MMNGAKTPKKQKMNTPKAKKTPESAAKVATAKKEIINGATPKKSTTPKKSITPNNPKLSDHSKLLKSQSANKPQKKFTPKGKMPVAGKAKKMKLQPKQDSDDDDEESDEEMAIDSDEPVPKKKTSAKGKVLKQIKNVKQQQESDEEEEQESDDEEIESEGDAVPVKKQKTKGKVLKQNIQEESDEEEDDDEDEGNDDDSEQESDENEDSEIVSALKRKMQENNSDDEEDDDDDDDDDEDEEEEESDDENAPQEKKIVRPAKKEKKPKVIDADEVRERSIVVSNWPITKDDNEIKAYFGKYGEVKSVLSHEKSRKFYVEGELVKEMQSCTSDVAFVQKEAVQKALEANGTVVGNHHLFVRPAIGHVDRDIKKSIFVGNLTYNCTEDDLWKAFEECGKIHSVKIMENAAGESKGYGFVNFDSEDCVEAALKIETPIVKGRTIRVSKMGDKQKGKGPQKRSFPSQFNSNDSKRPRMDDFGNRGRGRGRAWSRGSFRGGRGRGGNFNSRPFNRNFNDRPQNNRGGFNQRPFDRSTDGRPKGARTET